MINNNCERLQDLILLFKIPIGTREDFLEFYAQFGQVPSKSFASSAVHLLCKSHLTLGQGAKDRVPVTTLYWKAYEDISVICLCDLYYMLCRKQEIEHGQKVRGC